MIQAPSVPEQAPQVEDTDRHLLIEGSKETFSPLNNDSSPEKSLTNRGEPVLNSNYSVKEEKVEA